MVLDSATKSAETSEQRRNAPNAETWRAYYQPDYDSEESSPCKQITEHSPTKDEDFQDQIEDDEAEIGPLDGDEDSARGDDIPDVEDLFDSSPVDRDLAAAGRANDDLHY